MTALPLLRHLDELVSLRKGGRAGLFLDLDGTLAQIVALPGEASISPGIRGALDILDSRLELVCIVTGRPAADGLALVGLESLTYVGNHGMEWIEAGRVFTDPEAAPYTAYLQELLEVVKARCAHTDAIFEEKTASFAIHYRGSRDPEGVRELAWQAILEFAGDKVRVLTGKAHLNVLPPVALNKGTAVRSLVQTHRLDWALIGGDDVTDIDAFREARSLANASAFRCTNVAVLAEDLPPDLLDLADYTLAGVGEMEHFLTWWAAEAPPG